MESISDRLLKEVMRAADIMGPIENEINYTTDELEQLCVAAAMSGHGSRVSEGFSKGRSFVMFEGAGGTGSSSSDSIQKPKNLRFRKCDYCELWTSCRTRWCEGCRKKVYCGRLCQKQDWPVHRGSCRWARESSKGGVPGKQKRIFKTLDESRTADNETFFDSIMQELPWEPEDGNKAYLASLPYLHSELFATKRQSKNDRLLDALNLEVIADLRK